MSFGKVLCGWWVLHLGVAVSSCTWQVHAISSLLSRGYMTLITSAKSSFPQARTGSPIVFCSSRAGAVRHHQSTEHRWGSCDILSSLSKLFSWTISICKLVCECLMELSGAVQVRGNVALCTGRAASAHSLTPSVLLQDLVSPRSWSTEQSHLHPCYLLSPHHTSTVN